MASNGTTPPTPSVRTFRRTRRVQRGTSDQEHAWRFREAVDPGLRRSSRRVSITWMSTYTRFYDVVRRIPAGRVSTYGTVAREAGLPGRARQVGYAMAALRDDQDVPWHRVINARGEVSPRRGGSAFELIQRAMLEAEGIVFDSHERVDLNAQGWP